MPSVQIAYVWHASIFTREVLDGLDVHIEQTDAAAGALPGLTKPAAAALVEAGAHIVNDVFGPTVTLGGRFEPDVRDSGLLAVGASQVSVTAAGLEQIAVAFVGQMHRADHAHARHADVAGGQERIGRLPRLHIEVRDVAHLQNIVGALRVNNAVESVDRVREAESPAKA